MLNSKYTSSHFLGLFLADGYWGKYDGTVKIYSSDMEFISIVKEKNNIDFSLLEGSVKGKYILSSSNPFLKGFLRYHGLAPGSKNRSLSYPDKLEEKYFYSFLAGYFDGDGGVSFSNRDRMDICVGFTSNSKEFLEKLQKELNDKLYIEGGIDAYKENDGHKLRYSAYESYIILEKIKSFVIKDKDRVERGIKELSKLQKKKWLENEKEYLRENFNQESNEKIASELERTINSIKSKATRMDLR